MFVFSACCLFFLYLPFFLVIMPFTTLSSLVVLSTSRFQELTIVDERKKVGVALRCVVVAGLFAFNPKN